MQQTMQLTKTSIIAAIQPPVGDSLADLYISVMANTMVATLVRSAVGPIYALVLAKTALAINAHIMMTAAAKAASAIHPIGCH